MLPSAVAAPLLLLLLLLECAAFAQALPRCFSEKGHFIQHLPGELKLTGNRSPTCSNPGKYAGGACQPKEVTFEPQGCELEEYSPERIMRLLANRTLWLWGDSFSQQLHRSMTECSFFIGSPLLETSLEDRNCCTASSCVTFYGHGARICSVRADNALFSQTNKRCLRCLQEGDIMIANIGLHFNVRGEYAKAIKMGISDLQRIMKKVSVIWRTNPPQHFDTPGGNFYKGARTAARGCKAVGGLPMMQKAEWRNSIANPFIKKAGIPIMHVWETALKFPELHPGSMGNKMDCLHWCEYSNNVLRVWNSMMLNYIAGAENLCGDKLLHTCEDIQ